MKFPRYIFICLLSMTMPQAWLFGQTQPNYQTFDFLDFNIQLTTDHQTNPENIEYLKAAISNQLSKHGLKQASKADLNINIGVVIEEEIQTRDSEATEMRYLGQREYDWARSDQVFVGKYKVGTVTVELVDTKSNKVVWAGSDANVIRNQKKIQKRIDQGVARIFRKFDVNELGP